MEYGLSIQTRGSISNRNIYCSDDTTFRILDVDSSLQEAGKQSMHALPRFWGKIVYYHIQNYMQCHAFKKFMFLVKTEKRVVFITCYMCDITFNLLTGAKLFDSLPLETSLYSISFS